MNYNSIKKEIEKISGIETAYKEIMDEFIRKHPKKIIASPCFIIPPEINAAFNIITLKIPEFVMNNTDSAKKIYELYSAVITPEKNCYCNNCIDMEIKTYTFRTPSGYGEDAAVSLHNEISLMLETLFKINIKSINIESLQKETYTYETLRRLIRSITALRNENLSLLNNSELSLIFETAVILPPEIAIEYITPVLEEMKKINTKNEKSLLRGMLYAGRTIPSQIADSIEENGIMIIEDDSCSGRRIFDISLNAESEFIFYELLDAYSYRPLTPCTRPVNERYELLYKLLRNFNIDTVIFFKDDNCGLSVEDINFLRIRMMRDGIDPLVIDSKNYSEIVSDYVRKF